MLGLHLLHKILPADRDADRVNNKLENANPNAETEESDKTNEEAKKSSADEVKTKE